MLSVIKKTNLLVLLALFFGFSSLISCSKNETSNTVAEKKSQVFESTDALIEYSKQFINELNADQLKETLDGFDEYYLIDVRTETEFEKSYIPGSISIPRGVLEFRIASEEVWDNEGLYMPEKDSKIILYCKKGSRGTLAAKTLKELGYKNVFNLEGGFTKWLEKFPKEVFEPIVETGSKPVSAPQESSGGC